MDPPGKSMSHNQQQQPPPPPQPFEIALVRKLESKTSSVREAFLLLDADGDGRIGPADVRTVLHNELGVDITTEQEERLFSRTLREEDDASTKAKKRNGMGYADFAKYFQAVSAATFPASQSGLAAAVGFRREKLADRASSERLIEVRPQTVLRQRRRQVQQLLMTHSSRTTGSGMKETSLFLAIDVHRSGKVTMQEFLDWLNSVGGLQWSTEDLRQVVLGEIDADGDVVLRQDRLEKCWFRGAKNGEGETGMTEPQFAEFIESLDCK